MNHTLRPSRRLLGVALAIAMLLPGALLAQGQQPSVSVGGVGYVFYEAQLSSPPGGGAKTNFFDLGRAYVNVTGRLPEGVGIRVTSDLYRVSGASGNDAGSLDLRIKYAYATYTPKGSPITLKLGQIHTPWIDWEEGLWGYRMQGNVAMDRAGYLSSSDLGFGVDGAWNDQQLNMQVGIYNGEGYHGGVGDQRKDVMGRVSVRLLKTDDAGSRGGLRLSAYGGYGAPTGGGQRYRVLGMLSYNSKLVTLAGEGALTSDSTTAAGTKVKGRVISGFGVVRVPNSKAALIGRVDVVDPDTDTPDNGRTVIIGGVSYQLAPNLRLLADIDNTSFQAPGASAQTLGFVHMQFTF